MTRVRDIYDTLCLLAPPALQLTFDNAGFLVGRSDAACDRALPVYADWVRDRVMDSESASGVRPSQALNFYDTNPPSSIPPEE